MTNYKEIVAFLFKQYPSFQKKGISAYKENLNNIEKLCEIVGNPHKSIKLFMLQEPMEKDRSVI